MAAKTIQEALTTAIIRCEKNNCQFMDSMTGELRDFFAHEIMKHRGQLMHDVSIDDEMSEKILNSFFQRIFKGIPAFKKEVIHE